jgi:hypothetical protein
MAFHSIAFAAMLQAMHRNLTAQALRPIFEIVFINGERGGCDG